MKLAYDLSSVMWSCLLAGNDKEGTDVDFEGKRVHINSANYGYENSINLIVAAIKDNNSSPIDCIFVIEGMNSKARRLMIDPLYKSKRGRRPPEAYQEFHKLKGMLQDAFTKLGSLFISQDNVEADDAIAWLAKNSEEDLVIISNDNDLCALVGVNSLGASIHCRINGVVNHNKYGLFDYPLITVYKALVGDTSDSIPGIPGFGHKAFEDLHRQFGDAGLKEMYRLGMLGSLDELVLEAEQNKMIHRIYEGRDDFLRSFSLARMYPEWVNTGDDPIRWMPGFVQGNCKDDRLRHWAAQSRLITADNYIQASEFLRTKLAESPYYSLDLETSVPPESDDWLAERTKEGKGVDVISSRITGCSILFGRNTQYAYYISVRHTDTNNVRLDQLSDMLAMLDAKKVTAAHNAAGFELPVLYSSFGETWSANGWRGFYPNIVDTRIAASYWDENEFSHALKALSKKLFNYDQETYAQVTGGLKMDQISAERVVHYGCDDVYTSGGLWNFFKLFMQLEHTYKPFMEFEQKPMYLQALAFTQGINIDLPRLSKLSQDDEASEVKLSKTIDEFLIARGWDGTVCPTMTKLDATSIKQAVQVVFGTELVSQFRLVPKLVAQVADCPGGQQLADLMEENDIESINKLMRMKFVAKPTLNTGSPKQMQQLLYDTLGLPIRLRNKPTELMRKSGIKEGTPRTDEDTINMAIKQGDAAPETQPFLKALIEIKSIHTRQGLYWTAYPKMIHWRTGKLHAELRQSATNTRRYAGSSPNLQQMDSSPDGVRSAILPHHKNAVILSLDESAQEVRQLADYCQDPALLACYLGTKEQRKDVHSMIACVIAECSYEEFRRRFTQTDYNTEEFKTTKDQRDKAKVVIFATIYGATAPKIAEGLGITEAEAQAYIDAIYKQFPGIKQWKEDSEQFARANGCVGIHGGTIRHLASLIHSEDKYTASKALRQAGNARIQSAGGNQIKRVMARIWDSDLIERYDYRWYFSVHDETVHSVALEHTIPVTGILHSFMTEQFLNTVPSASSIGFGRNYGQLSEIGEVADEAMMQGVLDKLFQKEEALA